MSCRHAESARTRISNGTLGLNFHYPLTVELLQELSRGENIELRVRCLKAKKELIAGGMLKSSDVEYRMIRLRQPIQRQHADHRGETSDQNHTFKGDGNIRRPAIKRPSRDVVW